MTPSRGGPRRRAVPAGAVVLVAALAVAALLWGRRFLRYEIHGESMVPTLEPGDWVVVDTRGFGRRPPSPGSVVLARDPRDASRTVVKRVALVDGEGLAWLVGDNPGRSTDSRTFGPVPPPLVLGRVRWRYGPLRRISVIT